MGFAVELRKKYLPNVFVVSTWDYIVSLCDNLKIFSFFFTYYHDILWRTIRHHKKNVFKLYWSIWHYLSLLSPILTPKYGYFHDFFHIIPWYFMEIATVSQKNICGVTFIDLLKKNLKISLFSCYFIGFAVKLQKKYVRNVFVISS